MSRCSAKSVGRSLYRVNIVRRTESLEFSIDGAYSPNTVTERFFACAASHRNPPDEYANASIPSDG